MNTPLISVIVPVYKVEAYLDCCVQSIVDQTYSNLEIILVDDGSPDTCGSMCDNWAARDPRIKVVHKKNAGVAAARNAGLEIATGEWLLFVDADDSVSIYLVESLLREPLEKDSFPIAAFSRFADTPPQDSSVYTCKTMENNHFLSVRSSYFCWGVLYNREIVNEANLIFDTDLRTLEDEGWNTVYLLFVRRICYVAEPMYYYRQNPDSLTGGRRDHKKQAHAWSKVQNSVMKWFAAYDSDGKYKKESQAFFRHCQNKMIAECVKGNLRYADYRVCIVKSTKEVRHLLQRLFPVESVISKCMPRIYFACYSALMKVRNKLVAWKQGR